MMDAEEALSKIREIVNPESREGDYDRLRKVDAVIREFKGEH